MMYFEIFSPGTSFEAGRTPRARGLGGSRRFVALPGCSGKVAGVFGRILDENDIVFSLIFNGF